jgi:hypothetical protein
MPIAFEKLSVYQKLFLRRRESVQAPKYRWRKRTKGNLAFVERHAETDCHRRRN